MSTDRRPHIVSIGEVLWDVLPDGERLGGAPVNVACHAAQLGARASIVSAVGQDERGRRIHRALADSFPGSLEDVHLQEPPGLPTGWVDVTLRDGQPEYVIHRPVAWDALAWNDDLATLAATADAVVFGTLAQRDPASRATIRRFLQTCPGHAERFFDINLRQDYWDTDTIAWSLHHATIVKLNEDELALLIRELDLVDDEDLALDELARTYGLRLIALTRGSRGCRLARTAGSENVEARPEPVRVVDAVGAGDAFSAALLTGLLAGDPLDAIATRANAVGGYVASQSGAIPALPTTLVEL